MELLGLVGQLGGLGVDLTFQIRNLRRLGLDLPVSFRQLGRLGLDLLILGDQSCRLGLNFLVQMGQPPLFERLDTRPDQSGIARCGDVDHLSRLSRHGEGTLLGGQVDVQPVAVGVGDRESLRIFGGADPVVPLATAKFYPWASLRCR